MDVLPFRGIRYNLDRVASLSSVICPPYDVISARDQESYYAQDPYNVVRLELGKESPSDSAADNRYTRAASLLQRWKQEGILMRESGPAFYLLQHSFTWQGTALQRWGLAASVRLQEWAARRVRPHEAVFKKPVQDRLKLLRHSRVNTSPILGIVRHSGETMSQAAAELAQSRPALQADDRRGVTHRMWVVDDRAGVARLSALYDESIIYIADGHHRYETALANRRECLGEGGGPDDGCNFTLMALLDAADPGVTVLPTHRLVRLPGAAPESILSRLRTTFDVERLPERDRGEWLRAMGERGQVRRSIGLYLGMQFYLFSPRDEAAIQRLLPAEHSRAWKELDVSVLQYAVIKELLQLDSEGGEQVAYTQDAAEAMARVDSGEFQLAFLLNPLPVSSVMAVADAGDLMPHKSTYFYPKPPTGLVMHPLCGRVEAP